MQRQNVALVRIGSHIINLANVTDMFVSERGRLVKVYFNGVTSERYTTLADQEALAFLKYLGDNGMETVE